MKKINLMFVGLTLVDVVLKKELMGGYWETEIIQDNRYIGRLDMSECKLVPCKHIKNLYKVERR